MQNTEAVAGSCSVRKLILKNSQTLQENTCARVSLLVKLQILALHHFIEQLPWRLILKNTQISKSKNNDLKMSYYLNG